ncbi:MULTISPECIES: hypothetical protein [Mycolicibacterium]|jgi:hypothetical protein|nr:MULTISPECIES: hypothetical protein [Mycolicibacterium]MCW1822341.1 hypothetical protein [Mycolicibacterium senegalense]
MGANRVNIVRTTRITFIVALLCLSLTGCDLVGQALRPSMDIDYNDQRLNDGLESLLHEKKTGRLSDFTSWDWDEVHLFHEYTSRESIEKTVGSPVIKSSSYDSQASLLVFEQNGKPIKAAGVEGDYLRSQGHRATFPADVIVEPWGDGYLMLAVPAD